MASVLKSLTNTLTDHGASPLPLHFGPGGTNKCQYESADTPKREASKAARQGSIKKLTIKKRTTLAEKTEADTPKKLELETEIAHLDSQLKAARKCFDTYVEVDEKLRVRKEALEAEMAVRAEQEEKTRQELDRAARLEALLREQTKNDAQLADKKIHNDQLDLDKDFKVRSPRHQPIL